MYSDFVLHGSTFDSVGTFETKIIFPVIIILAILLFIGLLISIIKKYKAKEKLFGTALPYQYVCLIWIYVYILVIRLFREFTSQMFR